MMNRKYISFFLVITLIASVFNPIGAVASSKQSNVIDESVTCFDDSSVQISSRPSANQIIADFNSSGFSGVHPRILVTIEDIRRIKNLTETDEKMAEWYSQLLYTADSYLLKDKLIYELRDGVRLWYVALDLIDYIFVLGLAYQLSGNEKYAQKACEHMTSVATFPDWNPSHRIDVGGMSVGLAIGYDWLYDYMTPEQRTIIENGFYNNAGTVYVSGYQGYDEYIADGIMATNNHNAILNGGAVMAALSMFDVYPYESAYLISNALRGCEYSLHNFAPDGVWYEGLGYTCLELEYCSYLLASMHKIFGSSYNLDSAEGLDGVVESFLQLNSSLGAYAYGDTSTTSVQYDPAILWFGSHYENNGALSKYGRIFGFESNNGDLARTMLWYNTENLAVKESVSKDKYFSGTEVAVMRDQWSDNTKAFVGLKGGKPSAEHGHMDAGDFAYYANGARWAVDVGGEDYGLDGFWDTSDSGKRWTYFGMRAEAHNCLVIDPDKSGGFKSSETAKITRFESKDKGAIAVVDSTASYNSWKLKSAKRGFFFTDDRRSLVIRDELQTSTILSSNVYWFMQTEQNCVIDGNKVILTDKNDSENQVVLEFLCDKSFELSIGNCEPLLDSQKVSGLDDKSEYKRIILKTSGKGNINITAKLTPKNVNGNSISNYNIPISDWKIADGTIEPSVALRCDVSEISLPAGTNVTVKADTIGIDGDETVEFYNVTASGKYKIGEACADSPELKFAIGAENNISAALMKDGKVISESEPIKLVKGILTEKSEHWNVDFENNTIVSKNGGYICDSNGKSVINQYGESLQCNAGNSGNSSFTIEQNSDAINKDNGKSLKATVTSGDNLQLNEFRTTVSDNYAVFSYDYCVDDLSINRTVAMLHYYNGNTRYYAGGITLSMGGWLKCGEEMLKRIYPNTWVNVKEIIDIKGGKIHILFDDVYYKTLTTSVPIDSTYKIAVTAMGTSGNFWVDNFTAYEMTELSTDIGISISSSASGKILPKGTKVSISANTGGVSGDVAFYEIDSLGVCHKIDAVKDGLQYLVELHGYTQKICAALTDKNGIPMVYSEPLIFNGGDVNIEEILWNVDFENHTLNGGNISDKNGNKLTNSRGDYIQVNSGSANSSFTICANEVASKNNGMSLKASVANKDMVQMNEFRGTVRNNYAIWSYDYCVPDFSADRTIGHIAYYKTGASSWVTASPLTLSQGKWLKADGAYLKQIEANVWYKITFVIDISDDTAHVLLDDIYLTSISLPDIDRTFKMRVFVQNSSSGDYWIDNINVGEYTMTEIDKGFGNVCYMINGETVEKMRAGNLMVIPTVIGSADKKVYCMAALYEGSKMISFQMESLDMKKGAYLKPDFRFGEVTENMSVKIFLIDDIKNMKPICKNSDLE